MVKTNNILLILAVIILLMIVVLIFESISGLVTQVTEGNLDINKDAITFSRFDNSHVVAIVVDSGSDMISREFEFKSTKDGEIITRGVICEEAICEGKISKNFVIKKSFGSGDFYFEIDRKASKPYFVNRL